MSQGCPLLVSMVSDKGRGSGSPLNVTDLRCTILHFRENPTVLPAESALRREQGRLNKHLPQGLIRSGAISPKAHSPVKKLAIQGGAFSECRWPGREPGFQCREPE